MAMLSRTSCPRISPKCAVGGCPKSTKWSARSAPSCRQWRPLAIYYAFKQSEVASDGLTSAGWASFVQWEEIESTLDANFDPETQVALAWFATYGFDARASGELIVLANAKNVSLDGLFASGVFKDLKGKSALTPREELPANWTPGSDKSLTVWECVQHTARALNAEAGGGEAAARLVAQMGPKAADARALAYRLYEIASNKGWSQEALVYNQLAEEWPKLEDLARGAAGATAGGAPAQAAFAFEGS